MPVSEFKPFKQLPPNPDLKHFRNQAKQLLEAHQRGNTETFQRTRSVLSKSSESDILDVEFTLQKAQHVIASEYGFSDWSALLHTIEAQENTYDQYADRYADGIPEEENDAEEGLTRLDLALQRLLDYAGDVAGLTVLDAGCGEGRISRILASRGARVTGVDISPRLVDIARSRSQEANTHFLVHDLAHGRCPKWLNEGLAEYQGARYGAQGTEQLAAAAAHDQLVPWDQLNHQFSPGLSPQQVALGYQQSYSLVQYLVERYGFWRIRRILKTVGEGTPLDDVLTKEFHITLRRLQSNWRDWLPRFLDRS